MIMLFPTAVLMIIAYVIYNKKTSKIKQKVLRLKR